MLHVHGLVVLVYALGLQIQYVESRNVQGKAVNNTLTLGFTLPWTKGWLLGPQIGAAVILGIHEVYNRDLLQGYDVEWIFRDSLCNAKTGMHNAVNMWSSVDDLDGIIGDGCSTVCQPVSLLAAAWGIPVVSWGCASPSLSNKHIYPTFSRTTGPFIYHGSVFNAIADRMNWTRIGILTTPEDIWKLSAEAIKEELEHNEKYVTFQVVAPAFTGGILVMDRFNALVNTISYMKQKVQIFIFLSYTAERRNMLIAAYDLGLLAGDHAFMVIGAANHLIDSAQTFRPDIDHLLINGLIGVELRTPSGQNYEEFLREVIVTFQDPIFDHLPHISPSTNIKDISFYAGKIVNVIFYHFYSVRKF